MNEYAVGVGIALIGVQCALQAVKMAREMLAERRSNGHAPGTGNASVDALVSKLTTMVDVAVLGEKLSAIDRRLTAVHDSVHDLREGLQPIAIRVALLDQRLGVLEEKRG